MGGQTIDKEFFMNLELESENEDCDSIEHLFHNDLPLNLTKNGSNEVLSLKKEKKKIEDFLNTQ